MASHNDLGKKGEDLVVEFLTAKGYHVLDRNYRFERSEVDMVALMLDPGELVFVEVKTRSSHTWGYPELAVDETKKRHMIKAADSYIYERQLFTVPVRFDIIAVSMQDPENPMFQHIEDAFRAM